MPEPPPIFRASPPERWPALPEEMTFSTFQMLQSCPRRWALLNADYPAIWSDHGYPSRPSLAALPGVVQHAALEALLPWFAKTGVTDVRSAEAVTALRRVGGLTALLDRCLEAELERWRANPRAQPVLTEMRSLLKARLPSMREGTQAMLARLPSLPAPAPVPLGAPRSADAPGHSPPTLRRGHVLGQGVHTEPWIRHRGIGWKGKVDLLNVGVDGATIVDFKTGEPKPEHTDQIRLYALLWARDRDANPGGLPPRRIVLSYPNETMDVGFASRELETLENDLKEQTDRVRQEWKSEDPVAKPSARNCPFCAVRHLCPAYWSPVARDTLREEAQSSGASLPNDLDATLVRRHNGQDWDIRVGASPSFPDVSEAILRLATDPGDWLHIGLRVRLLSAATPQARTALGENREEEFKRMFWLNSYGEIYAVPSPS